MYFDMNVPCKIMFNKLNNFMCTEVTRGKFAETE